MRVLILDTYYARFLDAVYGREPSLATASYDTQLARLAAECFGTSDFYSRHLREQGVQAADLVVNCAPLQMRWAAENGMRLRPRGNGARAFVRGVLRRLRGRRETAAFGSAEAEAIALAQIRAFRPDVLYCQNLAFLTPAGLAAVKREVPLLVGQIACPLPAREYLAPFDLILTSFPHFVPRFRAMGIASEYFRIGFEPGVLERVGDVPRTRGVTFVGGISAAHGKGTQLLEAIARRVPLEIFGYGADELDPGSELRRRHRGEAWALDMYRVLCESRITINRHIDVAEDYANNMRLYEATGCGALLITDAKRNLGDLFAVGAEVVSYRSPDEAAALVEQFLHDDTARERIARAGQQRTLTSHTYEQRMRELVPILEAALHTASAA
ncbi:MAG TPA: glycosyltransferase [Gemmatimonadaceae bacterium]|nr:glycosyltransferase [Gemmatimonadaceae bacterium]